MDKFIKLTKQERKNIIQKVSFDLGLRFDIVEKDIWVCFVLDKLFSLKELEGKLVFKGGTCLSKAYNLIGRFSEDVDITISKACLDTTGTSNKPRKVESRIRHAAEDFVKDEIYKVLNDAFSKELEAGTWGLHFSKEDAATLLFQFPYSENITLWDASKWDESQWSDETDSYNYIKPSIKLEFGALGDDWPTEEKPVEPYAKKILPDIFGSTRVKVLDVKRNFLEKLLILHSIYYRPIDKKLKHHYSRHYYDVFCLIKAGVGKDALNLPEVLESVVENKTTFWNETWEPYDMIKSFSDIKLVPQDESRLKELEADYERMKEMFFADHPTFSNIIDELKKFKKVLQKQT
jgi:predicted nucleotidyltransferase component of viral defense system